MNTIIYPACAAVWSVHLHIRHICEKKKKSEDMYLETAFTHLPVRKSLEKYQPWFLWPPDLTHLSEEL